MYYITGEKTDKVRVMNTRDGIEKVMSIDIFNQLKHKGIKFMSIYDMVEVAYFVWKFDITLVDLGPEDSKKMIFAMDNNRGHSIGGSCGDYADSVISAFKLVKELGYDLTGDETYTDIGVIDRFVEDLHILTKMGSSVSLGNHSYDLAIKVFCTYWHMDEQKIREYY